MADERAQDVPHDRPTAPWQDPEPWQAPEPWQGPPAPQGTYGGARGPLAAAGEHPPYGYTGYPGPYPPPYYYPALHVYPPQETDSTAVVAFVLSIAGWVLVPIVAPVIAVILAGSAKQRIRESGGRIGGHGLATAAQAISWLQLGPVVLLVALLLLVVLPLAVIS